MEEVNWLRFILSFVLVLGLIGLFGLAMRKWGSRFSGVTLPGADQRLKLVEMRGIGPRHRLVLVKRDAVEHLLLIGPESVTLVESGIKREGE